MIMTGKERLIAVLNGKQPDRIPISYCMDEYFISSIGEQNFDMNLIETLRFLKNDILERHVPVYTQTYDDTVQIENFTKNDEYHCVFKTPVGTITEIRKFSGKTSYIHKHFLKSIDDVRIYSYITEHSCFTPNYKIFLEHQRIIGDDGLATPSGPLTPIQQLLQFAMGVENTTYSLFDYEDEMKHLFDIMHKKNIEAYEIIANSPAEVAFTYEDTSTTVLSRDQYEFYCAGYLNEYADILHAKNKIFIVHMCGKLKGFSDLIGKGKMDGIDSLCPPTTGDFWAHEARVCWGKEKIIIGGLEPPALTRFTEEETIRYTVDVINKMAPGDNFILSSGDAVSYGTPMNNLRLISEIVHRYGKYPLSGKLDAEHIITELIKNSTDLGTN